MQKLTKREKTLIYILVCFLIVVAGWFFLLNPALEKNSLVHIQYEQSQMELTSLEKQLKDYEAAPEQLKILEENYNEIADKYNSILSNDDIDKLLTSKVLAYGFRPKSMTIGPTTDAVLKSDGTTESTDTATNQNQQSSNSVIKQSTVNMTLTGDLNKLKKLMDAIHDLKGLEIGTLTYQLSGDTVNTINLSFIIYMIQK